jgi:hypothetical protein
LRQRELTERAAIDMGDNIAHNDLSAAGGSAVTSERFDQVTSGCRVGHEKSSDADSLAAGRYLAWF